jgi:NAD(P)H-hydrate epimerase
MIEPSTPPASLPRLPARSAESHKGDFGRTLLVGGSRGMSGAIVLAGMAALRSGAGLVQLAVPETILPIVAGYEPSYMTAPLPFDPEGRIDGAALTALEELASKATAVGVGPGLGQSAGLTEVVRRLYTGLRQPLILDADALNALAPMPEELGQSAGPRILTPHPGEFGRLMGVSALELRSHREELARELAVRCRGTVVLKGHRTVIAHGQAAWINATGNPGMATGGTGDVLTGIITALAGQGLAPPDAARLGVHLHGLAGDLAAAELGQVSLIASDLLHYLPRAFRAF